MDNMNRYQANNPEEFRKGLADAALWRTGMNSYWANNPEEFRLLKLEVEDMMAAEIVVDALRLDQLDLTSQILRTTNMVKEFLFMGYYIGKYGLESGIPEMGAGERQALIDDINDTVTPGCQCHVCSAGLMILGFLGVPHTPTDEARDRAKVYAIENGVIGHG